MEDNDAPADPTTAENLTTEHEYEEVFETSEPDVLPVIKSVLDAAGIPWATHGEGLMNLFPSEAMSVVSLTDEGEVRIYVPESRAEEARALLSGDFQLAERIPELQGGEIPNEGVEGGGDPDHG